MQQPKPATDAIVRVQPGQALMAQEHLCVWKLLAKGRVGWGRRPSLLIWQPPSNKRAQAAAPCSTPCLEAPAQHNAKVPLGALVQQLARGAEG